MNSKGKFKFKSKMIVPLFIAAIFLSSVLVVFATGGMESKKARMVLARDLDAVFIQFLQEV